MFNFLKRKNLEPAPKVPPPAPAPPPEESDPLILLTAELGKAFPRKYIFTLREMEQWPQIAGLDAAQKVTLLHHIIAWQQKNPGDRRGNTERVQTSMPTADLVRIALVELVKGRLPWSENGLLELLAWSSEQDNSYFRCLPQINKAVEGYLQHQAMTPAVEAAIRHLLERSASDVEKNSRLARSSLERLLGPIDVNRELPLVAGEAWSDAARGELESLPEPQRLAWVKLLEACRNATGSVPSAKWLKEVQEYRQEIGPAVVWDALTRWFVLVSEPRTQPKQRQNQWEPAPNLMLDDKNADVLKGLAWTCAGQADPALARGLTSMALAAYRKVPGVGPRCQRLGTACIFALGEMPGMEGLAQLAILKVRLRFIPTQKAIAAAFEKAARRQNLPAEEIEELSVPTYGLEEVGLRCEELSGFTALLKVEGSDTSLSWLRQDGKPQAGIPAVVRQEHADELKELKETTKEIERMLTAQRSRLDSLFLEQRSWRLEDWRARYLDHPLIGTLARRLIWKFSRGDRAASGVWDGQQLVGWEGQALDWLEAETKVELWHPLSVDVELVLAWRQRLEALGITQPIKQAHREVYLLTDAERATGIYSNRFAAHILRQHQFNALCSERNWKNQLRLMVDDVCPPAHRLLPRWGLRAEFWIEGVGSDYGTDTNEAGTFYYLATDQVRFYPIEAEQLTAHAYGGGYCADQQDVPVPVPLEQVPPLVISEILRDVDLFVGVASVGNDPTWFDGGPGGAFTNYWQEYSFGELTESALTRKQVLTSVLPRLKIANRCELEGRFLIVHGKLRTYKIHLGSSNIQMMPDNQYLCIVPSQHPVTAGAGEIYLPFEGDRTLAVILSKAFMLTADDQIKDETITRQIRM